jgi:hypothetical protein
VGAGRPAPAGEAEGLGGEEAEGGGGATNTTSRVAACYAWERIGRREKER